MSFLIFIYASGIDMDVNIFKGQLGLWSEHPHQNLRAIGPRARLFLQLLKSYTICWWQVFLPRAPLFNLWIPTQHADGSFVLFCFFFGLVCFVRFVLFCFVSFRFNLLCFDLFVCLFCFAYHKSYVRYMDITFNDQ